MNCGCFYEVYFSDKARKHAIQECIKNPLPTNYNGKPVSGILSANDKIRIVMKAGFHTVTKIDNVISDDVFNIAKVRSYYLGKAEALALLPFENGYASIYQGNGLVRNGGRPESYLLWMGYPANYYAGWNRHHSMRRYGLDPSIDGFHNPFWVQSVIQERTPQQHYADYNYSK